MLHVIVACSFGLSLLPAPVFHRIEMANETAAKIWFTPAENNLRYLHVLLWFREKSEPVELEVLGSSVQCQDTVRACSAVVNIPSVHLTEQGIPAYRDATVALRVQGDQPGLSLTSVRKGKL